MINKKVIQDIYLNIIFLIKIEFTLYYVGVSTKFITDTIEEDLAEQTKTKDQN